MTATYDALCEHGYTDLTAQNIADRTDKSKSLLFYHYDSKEDLMADFVDYVLDRFADRVDETAELPPVERLARFVDWFLYSPDDEERTAFHTAMLELRTQAPYNERFREQLRKSDDQLRGHLEEILEEGVETGNFRQHDPVETAALMIAAFDGARIRQLTIGRDEYLAEVRSATAANLFEGLLAEGVTMPEIDGGEGEAGREPIRSEPTTDRGESDATDDGVE